MNAFLRIAFGLCFLVATGSLPAVAQRAEPQLGVGGISGKLMGNLEAVSGAEVVLMQKDKLIDKTTTDENGHYEFLYINPGEYDIKASKILYRTSIIIHIPVHGDEWTKNDFYLPKLNGHKQHEPFVETYDKNIKRYMQHYSKG